MPKNKPIGVYFLSIIVLLGAIYTIIIFLPYLSIVFKTYFELNLKNS